MPGYLADTCVIIDLTTIAATGRNLSRTFFSQAILSGLHHKSDRSLHRHAPWRGTPARLTSSFKERKLRRTEPRASASGRWPEAKMASDSLTVAVPCEFPR
jgi:hypothetical protein